MKAIAKLVGGLLVAAVLFIAGPVGLVRFLNYRSERVVVALVAQLPPGTPFAAVVERLGQPSQRFTEAESIVPWLEKVGARVDPSVAADSVLYAFAHRGPPYRYILVFTDRESKRVKHAVWCSM